MHFLSYQLGNCTLANDLPQRILRLKRMRPHKDWNIYYVYKLYHVYNRDFVHILVGNLHKDLHKILASRNKSHRCIGHLLHMDLVYNYLSEPLL